MIGSLWYFLGLEIVKSKKDITLSQRKYNLSLFYDIGFLGNKPIRLFMDLNLKLSLNDGDPIDD